MPRTLVLATRNRKKIEEIRRVVDASTRLLTTADFPGCPEVEEDGATFHANAAKKARAIAQFTGHPALADDSGLVVDALDGAPGIHSARFAGAEADDAANLRKLLADLDQVPPVGRTARFVCVLALAGTDGAIRYFEGEVAGVISHAPRGHNGFGYDPVFIPAGESRTFAEMAPGEKDDMSHRGQALRAFGRAMDPSAGSPTGT